MTEILSPPRAGAVMLGLPTVSICIATSGRRDVLSRCVALLRGQDQPADELLICPARDIDCDEDAIRVLFPALRVVRAEPGLPSQRNALLEATRAEVAIFLDDDFVMERGFVARTRLLFAEQPEIVIATGAVIADGILGPGLEVTDVPRLLQAAAPARAELEDVHNAYGCNMVIRMEPVRRTGIRFDPALPLYAWLEDVDFCRRMAPHGRIVKDHALQGVHLGTKTGRGRGRRLGYSQIANPLYLHGKGSLSLRRALAQIARNLCANTARSLRPEPWVDRRGRLAGNAMALGDLVRGRMRPGRILEFD